MEDFGVDRKQEEIWYDQGWEKNGDDLSRRKAAFIKIKSGIYTYHSTGEVGVVEECMLRIYDV